MKWVYTSVNEIRKRVFAEVAKLSYDYEEGDLSKMEKIPYRIIPGEISQYRESVFLERAIVKERIRLAMGLTVRNATEQGPVSEGAEECVKPEKYYQPPLINVIQFACHKCPDNEVTVTDLCQSCLAHPCQEVCPRKAISFEKGKSQIDQSLCIKCGKCLSACPYGAIVRLERPCAKVCGMNAIETDEFGRAQINQEKCVSCGMCLANCPFGAIADKSQIFQAIQALRSDAPVYAAIAPAWEGQFGKDLTPDKLRSAFKALGFKDIVEVAIGADLCTIQEAQDFVDEVPEKLPFMATSCCPAWSMMAKKLFPEQAECISMALTPMVLTGRLIKKKIPNSRIAFIGPCAAKKLEASRKSVRSEIDFVLTFEEVMGMFEAKEVDFAKLETDHSMHGASGDGRGFSIGGGVAEAVANCIREQYPDREILMERAEGLDNCKKMLTKAKTGKMNGYLLEGMACPGGCIGGAGTRVPLNVAKGAVQKAIRESTDAHSLASRYKGDLPDLEKE